METQHQYLSPADLYRRYSVPETTWNAPATVTRISCVKTLGNGKSWAEIEEFVDLIGKPRPRGITSHQQYDKRSWQRNPLVSHFASMNRYVKDHDPAYEQPHLKAKKVRHDVRLQARQWPLFHLDDVAREVLRQSVKHLGRKCPDSKKFQTHITPLETGKVCTG